MILVDLFSKLNIIQINQVQKRKSVKIKNQIPDTSGLVKKTDYNAKSTETEGKIPIISGFTTTTATAV